MKNTIIRVPTIEDWRKVVRKLLDEGCEWMNGDKEICENDFESYKGDSAILVRNNKLGFSPFNYFHTYEGYKDYKFLTAKEFLEEHKFKVGDRVECIKEYSWIKVGMKGKIMEMKGGYPPIGVEWEESDEYEGHTCNGHCKSGYGFFVNKENIQLLKDPKYEEIRGQTIDAMFIDEYSYSIDWAIIKKKLKDNLPYEGKITKMKHYLLRKLSPSKRVLYKNNYIGDDLDLTEKGEDVLMDILADKFEKEMVEIAKEEEKENKEDE